MSKEIIITFGEMEALRICEGKIPGLSYMTTTVQNPSKIAASYILQLAERIKNERVSSLLESNI